MSSKRKNLWWQIVLLSFAAIDVLVSMYQFIVTEDLLKATYYQSSAAVMFAMYIISKED